MASLYHLCDRLQQCSSPGLYVFTLLQQSGIQGQEFPLNTLKSQFDHVFVNFPYCDHIIRQLGFKWSLLRIISAII